MEVFALKNTVIIKSFPNGISVILDSSCSFDEIKQSVYEKFQESAKFFGKAKTVLSFEGRILSDQEEMELIDTITEAAEIEISCILEKNEEKNQVYLRAMNQFAESTDNNDGQFYKGTLKSGQVLETDYSIVILGDVNPGATVVSTGNIVILGTLYGTAYAGGSGYSNNFVAALDMKPSQIKIGDIIAKQGEKGFVWMLKAKSAPKIAYVKGNTICIEPITKDLLNNIPLS